MIGELKANSQAIFVCILLASSIPVLQPRGAMVMTAGAVIGSFFNFGIAAWGITTAIGLFRLEPWSRISLLIFSSLLVAVSAFDSLGWLILLTTPLPLYRKAVTFFLLVVPFSAGMWWLIFFTRRSVAAQFSGTPKPSSL